jgi:hypothetical protein
MSKHNLTLYRNTTYNMTYTHVEDMTGGKVYFTVKNVEYDTDNTDSSAMPQKIVPTFSNSGLLASWKLTDSDTYIEPGKYFYDIVYENASGEASPPIFEGTITIKPHPTNKTAFA